MNVDFRERLGSYVADAKISDEHPITYKSVFGAVAAYANDKIFITCGKFGVALKLPEETCRTYMAEGNGGPLKYFEKGHVKNGYVVLFDAVLVD